MTTQCPVCDVCKAEPHMIDEHCENCLICENKEGFIRRGQPKPLLEITVRESNVIDIEDIKVNENIIKNEGVNKNDRHTRIN